MDHYFLNISLFFASILGNLFFTSFEAKPTEVTEWSVPKKKGPSRSNRDASLALGSLGTCL
jgi:hypothetical protein